MRSLPKHLWLPRRLVKLNLMKNVGKEAFVLLFISYKSTDTEQLQVFASNVKYDSGDEYKRIVKNNIKRFSYLEFFLSDFDEVWAIIEIQSMSQTFFGSKGPVSIEWLQNITASLYSWFPNNPCKKPLRSIWKEFKKYERNKRNLIKTHMKNDLNVST